MSKMAGWWHNSQPGVHSALWWPFFPPMENTERVQPGTSHGRWLNPKIYWHLESPLRTAALLWIQKKGKTLWNLVEAAGPWKFSTGFGFGPVLCVSSRAVSGCHLNCGIQLCYQASGLFCLRHTSRASGRLPFDSLTLTLRLFPSPQGMLTCWGSSSVSPAALGPPPTPPTTTTHTALIWFNTSSSIQISVAWLHWSEALAEANRHRPYNLKPPLLQFDARVPNLDPYSSAWIQRDRKEGGLQCRYWTTLKWFCKSYIRKERPL